MIANTDYPQNDPKENKRRKFIGKILAVTGLGLVLGKLAPRSALAKVDGKYTNAMPNVKTSFTKRLE
jgi:hypothetical protein